MAFTFTVLADLSASGKDVTSSLGSLVTLLTCDPTQRAGLKIRTLNNLINTIGTFNNVNTAQRFQVLIKLLEFATAGANGSSASGANSPASLVLQPLPTLSAIVEYWKLTPEQSLALYAASYKLAQVVGAPAKREQDLTVYNLGNQPTVEQEYLFALLKAIDAAAASNPAVLKEKSNIEYAVQAALASIANGLSSTIHVLDPTNVFPLAIIQSLSASNSVNHSAAYALLKILADGDLAAYIAFEKSHGAFLKDNAKQLDSSILLRKMRTLALCRLAVTNQSAIVGTGADNILTYQNIRDSLQLGSEDVESVVIDAVMAGRLDAKMDQEAETLCIKRVTGGVPLSIYIGPNSGAAWTALGSRLKSWKQNIRQVLTTLNLSQQVEQQDAGEELQ